MRDHVVAVDIGTASARAGVFDRTGRLLARAKHAIVMQRPREDHAEHDSEDIWRATCHAVRTAMSEAGIGPERIAALGFDATCSLVVRNGDGGQLTVSTTGEDRFDTIVWLDHRAMLEAEDLSATGHPVLGFSGGSLSPEMQMPKLLWLKRNLPQTWARAGHFFDLADFMTWRATGSTARSRCTLTAKWNYLAHEDEGWRQDFLVLAGLEDVLARGALPAVTVAAGKSVGRLSVDAARELGLDTGCCVSAGLIDAYAGAFGVLAGAGEGKSLEQAVALIGGTSSCIVSLSADAKPGRSLWGPYYEAVLPGHWLVEGGQSATGALLDHVVRMHAAGGEPDADLHGSIVARVRQLRAEQGTDLACGLHMLPDFHGNRSPLADPHARGVISGLTLDTSFDGLCRLYWRTCVAIALGIRHILDTMEEYGYRFEALHVTGGHVHNPLLLELYADVTGRKVVVPQTQDAVLLGTAMTAAAAGGVYADVAEAGRRMAAPGRELLPEFGRAGHYDRDYRRFLTMIRHRDELNSIV
nr:ribulokinase [Rhizobium sp. Q54]